MEIVIVVAQQKRFFICQWFTRTRDTAHNAGTNKCTQGSCHINFSTVGAMRTRSRMAWRIWIFYTGQDDLRSSYLVIGSVNNGMQRTRTRTRERTTLGQYYKKRASLFKRSCQTVTWACMHFGASFVSLARVINLPSRTRGQSQWT